MCRFGQPSFWETTECHGGILSFLIPAEICLCASKCLVPSIKQYRDGMESSLEEESYFLNKTQGGAFKIKVRSSPSPTQSLKQLPLAQSSDAAKPPLWGPHLLLFCSLWSGPLSSVLCLKHAWHSSASGPLHWLLLLHECFPPDIHMAHILTSSNSFSKCLFPISHSQTTLHKTSQSPTLRPRAPYPILFFSTFCCRFAL